MRNRRSFQAHLLASAAAVSLMAAPAITRAAETTFNIAPQDLETALADFSSQSMMPVLATSEVTSAKQTRGVTGVRDPALALSALLQGTGLSYRREGDAFLIVRTDASPQSDSAAGGGAEVEALIVTAQKREEDIQDVPIAISAFTQEALERSQIAGGPDLMTQVPNMTFTKTNFTGYSIQIRGIGTQAISATIDPAVAVAFNNTPFIRNRFFEQEFYDLSRVEVLRGPQGTLYGRNATAGVVNIISAKPVFGYEAKASADVANYNSTRLEGMVNIPLVEDMVALRIAGAWTKREGYSTNQITGNQIDGRDLWSSRVSLRIEPNDRISANLIWEHFEESDDRIRSGKQLCKRDDRTELAGYRAPGMWIYYSNLFSQGCIPASMYAPESFEAPDGLSLPYYHPLGAIGLPTVRYSESNSGVAFDPYVSTVQSPDLRVIESTVDPEYRANTDIVELQLSFDLPGNLTLAAETGWLSDDIFSLQDYNRFNTAEGAFNQEAFEAYRGTSSDAYYRENLLNDGVFCDPQIGCSSRLVAVDLSTAQSTQFSQEFRLSSDYEGPFNFSLGGNFLRYDTEDKYYVFINTLSLLSAISWSGHHGGQLPPYQAGVSDNHECLPHGMISANPNLPQEVEGCVYIDPNPIGQLNDLGHNYFLSRNPYKLISYAVFGEAYYQLTDTLKVTGGLRWTVDKKEAPRIPSWILGTDSVGYPVQEVVEQEWREPTGRLTLDWKPALGFTDDTLLYASYAHGYKAGGANPPPSGIVFRGAAAAAESEAGQMLARMREQSATAPRTFEPEFVDAFEVGSKNTLLDGALTLNLAAFYYDYQSYQISQIVNRSAVTLNFDAQIWGLEIEADWRPVENLRLGFKGGYENTRVADGSRAIDLMDRTGDRDDWIIVRPFPSFANNCVLPAYALADASGLLTSGGGNAFFNGNVGPCEYAYQLGYDPATLAPYVANPDPSTFPWTYPADYPGFNPLDASHGHNNGEGFYKDLSGNELPNAPSFTASVTADYTVPLPRDWLMTLHTDLYYQSEAWTRIFNMEGYDKLKAYTNVNVAAIFTNEDAGWKVMAYVKNVFDRDSITGAFLNSDDTGLTTNVFLTEPRLYGLRVTKDFEGGSWWTGGSSNAAGHAPLWVELGGMVQRHEAPYSPIGADAFSIFSEALDPLGAQNRDLDWGDGRSVRVSYQPKGAEWRMTASARFGKTNGTDKFAAHEPGDTGCALGPPMTSPDSCTPEYFGGAGILRSTHYNDGVVTQREDHTLIDFMVGKDFGFGQPAGDSAIGLGVRYGRFNSRTRVDGVGITNWDLPHYMAFKYDAEHDRLDLDVTAQRKFQGAGPVVSWDASKALVGSDETGRVNIDWTVTAGVLFGKQTTTIEGRETVEHAVGPFKYQPWTIDTIDPNPVRIDRNEGVTVPLVDLSLGLSYEVGRMKVGAGYRWERHFDALDVGYDEAKEADRTIDGPYFKFAVGFGG